MQRGCALDSGNSRPRVKRVRSKELNKNDVAIFDLFPEFLASRL